jgi:calcium binding protein 39
MESQHFRSLFDYIQFPDFNIQSDVFKTFKVSMCIPFKLKDEYFMIMF